MAPYSEEEDELAEDPKQQEQQGQQGQQQKGQHRNEQPSSDSSKPADSKILLTVQHQKEAIKLMVNVNKPLKKLFTTAAQRWKKNPAALRFLYEGERLLPDETPREHSMSDGDHIEAELEQYGG